MTNYSAYHHSEVAKRAAEGTDAEAATVGLEHSAKTYAEQAAVSAATASPPPLFSFDWYDHELNDLRFLRADTFSWQDGNVYSNAYNHLVDDIDGKTATTETVAGTTVTYYLADDGHKIVDVDDVAAIEAVFAATGVAWYYVIDTTNQRFKLPRTKYGFVGYRDAVGKYVPETLPNLKGNVGITSSKGIPNDAPVNGCFKLGTSLGSQKYASDSSSSAQSSLIGFDASGSSQTYQNNAPVQQRATQMYLYFYVGQFTQTATEQTAGLNAELFNGKVDLNAANLSAAGKSLIAGLGMPSDVYEDLTLGSSGSQYTAPANGCFCLRKASNAANQYATLFAYNSGNTPVRCSSMFIPTSGSSGGVEIYVRKGQVIQINYSLGGDLVYFRFIYAQGSESEAS